DPDIGPRGRDDEAADAFENGSVAYPLAVRAEVGEPLPRTAPSDAGLEIGGVDERNVGGGGLALIGYLRRDLCHARTIGRERPALLLQRPTRPDVASARSAQKGIDR